MYSLSPSTPTTSTTVSVPPPPQTGAFVRFEETRLMGYYHPKSIVYKQFPLDVVHSLGFDKRTVTGSAIIVSDGIVSLP